MMILRSAPPSPFGRKVKIAADILGLSDKIEIVASDTNNPDDPLRRGNPLGKIPCLVLEDGTNIYDSRVILEHLDHVAGGNRIIPAKYGARLHALTGQALADGLADAALVMVYEARWRTEGMRDGKWLAHQQGKVDRALAALEAHPPHGAIDIAHIATACGLGYLDLRFGGTWRAAHPGLVAWLDHFAAAVPAFEKTKVLPA